MNIVKVEDSFQKFFINSNKNSLLGFLLKIDGIGFLQIKKLYLKFGYNTCLRNRSMSYTTFLKEVGFIQNSRKNEIYNNVEEKKRLKSYSGMRHLLKLPVRGQRTHTNADTIARNVKKEI